MKVVLNTIMAGPNGSGQPGDVLQVSDEFRQALIDSKGAHPYEEPEVAAAAAPLATGLMSRTNKELQGIAEASGIELASRMTKAQIVEALVAGGIPEDGSEAAADDEDPDAEETAPDEQATASADGENAAERTGQPNRTRTPTED